MDFKFLHLNKIYTVTIEKSDDAFKAIIDGTQYEVKDYSMQLNNLSFIFDEKFYTIYFAQDRGKMYLAFEGDYFFFERAEGVALRTQESAQQKGNSVNSPMPGLIVKISVAIGDHVKEGMTLAIVEAMKMQNELRAPRDGVVKKINFDEGDQVDALQVIVELEMEKF